METYFDSHIDLLQRQLSKQSDKLKMRAEEKINDVLKKDLFKLNKIKAPSGDLERELNKFKIKVLCCSVPQCSVTFLTPNKSP